LKKFVGTSGKKSSHKSFLKSSPPDGLKVFSLNCQQSKAKTSQFRY